jgi:hypothetical protein
MDLKSVRDKDRHKNNENSNNLSTINYEFKWMVNCEHELYHIYNSYFITHN